MKDRKINHQPDILNWVLKTTESNHWLSCSANCSRICWAWWAIAGCAALMAVTEYGEQLLAVQ